MGGPPLWWNRERFNAFRREARSVLLPIRFARHAIGISLEGNGAVLQMRQNVRSDSNIVVDHLGFGELRCRVQHLAQARALDRMPVDLERNFVGIARRRWSRASRFGVSRRHTFIFRCRSSALTSRMNRDGFSRLSSLRHIGAPFYLREVHTAPPEICGPIAVWTVGGQNVR